MHHHIQVYAAAATIADLARVNEATTDPSWSLSLHPKLNLYLQQWNFIPIMISTHIFLRTRKKTNHHWSIFMSKTSYYIHTSMLQDRVMMSSIHNNWSDEAKFQALGHWKEGRHCNGLCLYSGHFHKLLKIHATYLVSTA